MRVEAGRERFTNLMCPQVMRNEDLQGMDPRNLRKLTA